MLFLTADLRLTTGSECFEKDWLVEGCFSLAPEALSSVRRRRKPLFNSFYLTDIVQDGSHDR